MLESYYLFFFCTLMFFGPTYFHNITEFVQCNKLQISNLIGLELPFQDKHQK